jgi:hypothetical protein
MIRAAFALAITRGLRWRVVLPIMAVVWGVYLGRAAPLADELGCDTRGNGHVAAR